MAEQPLFCARRVPGETTRYHLRVERSQIGFLRFIFEAYDGIAVIRTVDAARGEVVLHAAPGCEEVVETVLADLSKDLLIEAVLTNGDSVLED